jgi:hypothetical protein
MRHNAPGICGMLNKCYPAGFVESRQDRDRARRNKVKRDETVKER